MVPGIMVREIKNQSQFNPSIKNVNGILNFRFKFVIETWRFNLNSSFKFFDFVVAKVVWGRWRIRSWMQVVSCTA